MPRRCIYYPRGDVLLALVDYKYVRPNPFRRAPKAWCDTVFGMRIIRLTAEISRRSGRCDKSVRALIKAGADRACFSKDFPARQCFDVREPIFSIAYEHLLPQIIEQHGFEGETALLVAGADPHSGELLRRLSQRFRYVLTTGVPRRELERLRRTVGASVIAEPEDEKTVRAELAVFLRPPMLLELSSECVALAADTRYLENVVYSRYVELPELDVPDMAPEGFERRVLLSEALRRGVLPWDRVMSQNSRILTKQHK